MRADDPIGQVQVVRQHVIVEQSLRKFLEHVCGVVDAAQQHALVEAA